MRLLSRIILAILVLVSGTSLHKAQAESAQEGIIEINVAMEAEPKSAMALFMNSTGTTQQAVRSLERVDSSTIIVSVPYRESDLSRDTMVTAMVLADDGTPYYGNMRPVFSPDSKESYLRIPDCAPEKISEAAMQGQLSLLESLVEVRSARRGVAQVKVAKILDGKFLNDLRKLEHGFGLNYPEELNSNLNPIEIIDRLSRLTDAINQAHKTSGKSGTNSDSKKSK